MAVSILGTVAVTPQQLFFFPTGASHSQSSTKSTPSSECSLRSWQHFPKLVINCGEKCIIPGWGGSSLPEIHRGL